MNIREIAAVSLSVLAVVAGAEGLAAQADSKGSVGSPVIVSEAVPAGFGSWAELMAVQEKLDRAAERIMAVRDDGYGSIEVAAERRELVLHWKGAVRHIAATMPDGLAVTVAKADFSWRELDAARADLVGRLRGRSDVSTVAPAADSSGLVVRTTGGPDAVRATPAVAAAAVPVTVRSGSGFQPLFSRQADTAPHWGGAVWGRTADEKRCSTGFAFRMPGSTVTSMMTAAHCETNNGHDIFFPGTSGSSGTFLDAIPQRDVARLATNSAARMYTGDAASSTRVPVTGGMVTFVGDFVCTSGAMSGQHCGVRVEAIGVVTNPGQSNQVVGLAVARRTTPSCAVAPGDSGGPVFGPIGDPLSFALAAGIISSGSDEVACTDGQGGGYREVAYQPIDLALAAFGGATLVTETS